MNEIETIVLGVISGIATTAVLFLFGLLFRNHVIPWYRSITYSGVDISGTWICQVANGDNKARFEMTLVQKAHALSGDTTIIQGIDLQTPTSISNLKIKGGIWEGYITINMQSKDRTRLSYSTSLLQVLNGGATLKGNYTYRSILTDEIESLVLLWRRKK